jgi:hypothetical protein
MRLTRLQLLRSVQHALNVIPRKSLRADPNGIKDTYELAALVDEAVIEAESNKQEEDE